MKKLISAILILVTVFALMAPALADNATGFGIDMWVNCADGYRLNVREQPSVSSTRIAKFDCGTTVTVLSDCTSSKTEEIQRSNLRDMAGVGAAVLTSGEWTAGL